MKLLPIKEKLEDNEAFINNPVCAETLPMTIDFYNRVGFVQPWIGYYAEENGNIIGYAGFKGKPINGTVEIAYGTFEQYQQQGMGTEMCNQLVHLSLSVDPSVRITARTLPQENFSTNILKKNNFKLTGIVNDPEDGDVWEWIYQNQ